MNPCPCGYYGDSEKHCTPSHTAIARCQKRISGSLETKLVPLHVMHHDPVFPVLFIRA